MGNTASFDEVSQVKQDELVVAPPNWNNQVNFQSISPTSDLSNPSQIVKRKTGTTPHRHRLSKVALQAHLSQMKQAKTLPEPQAFYFVRQEEKETPSQRQQHIFLRKAARAKKIFLGCMKESATCTAPNHLKSKSKQAIEQRKAKPETEKIAPPPQITVPVSFKPVMREVEEPYYLHNEDSYVERILNVSSSPPDSLRHPTVREEETEARVEKKERANTMDSPVAALFPKDKIERVPSQIEKMKVPDLVITQSIQEKVQAQINSQLGKTNRGRDMSRRSHEPARQERIRRQHQREVQAACEARSDITGDQEIKPSLSQASTIVASPRVPVSVKDRISVFENKDDSTGPGKILSKASIWRENPTEATTLQKTSEDSHGMENIAMIENDEEEVNKTVAGQILPPGKRIDISTASTDTQPGRIISKNNNMSSRPTSEKLVDVTNVKKTEKESRPGVAHEKLTHNNTSDAKALAANKTATSKEIPSKAQPSSKAPQGPALLQMVGWRASKPPSKHQNELPTLLKLAGWNRSHNVDRNGDRPKSLGAAGAPRANMEASLGNQRSNNAASMLRDTYPIARAFTSDELLYRNRNTDTISEDCRVVAIKTTSPKRKPTPSDSPSVMSIDTIQSSNDTERMLPILSEEALVNAGFLFSPSFVPEKTTQKALSSDVGKRETNLGIDTFYSRNRLLSSNVTVSEASATMIRKAVSADESEKRVRFSEVVSDDKPFRSVSDGQILQSNVIGVPEIQSKLSDLTEPSRGTSIESSTLENTLKLISETNDVQFVDDKSSVETRPKWSSRGSGVTPFRKGMSSSSKTNSPFIRFNHAREKFSNASSDDSQGLSNFSAETNTRNSEKISGGLVSSRVAALQQKLQEGSKVVPGHGSEKPPTKIRRNTTAHNAIAPRPAKLASPFFPQAQRESILSPTVINGDMIEKLKSPIIPATEKDIATTTEEDAFEEIMKSRTFDESDVMTVEEGEESIVTVEKNPFTGFIDKENMVSDSDSDDETEDAFALIQKDSLDEDSHDGTATVSTVRQTQNVLLSYDKNHLAESSSTLSHDPTVSTVRPQRLSMASSSMGTAVSSREQIQVQKFRNAAPVRPNEQYHRTLPGSNILSPMQKAPSVAMKWRAMAAAAQQRDEKRNPWKSGKAMTRTTLGEHNMNIKEY